MNYLKKRNLFEEKEFAEARALYFVRVTSACQLSRTHENTQQGTRCTQPWKN